MSEKRDGNHVNANPMALLFVTNQVLNLQIKTKLRFDFGVKHFCEKKNLSKQQKPWLRLIRGTYLLSAVMMETCLCDYHDHIGNQRDR